MTRIDEMLSSARDAITVRRVFAEPYEKNGVTVIAAARVSGGGGGGGGHDQEGQEGEGGGFGMAGRPAGAYVIKEGSVSWLPAVDPVRIVAVLGAVLITLLVGRTRVAAAHERAAAAGILSAPAAPPRRRARRAASPGRRGSHLRAAARAVHGRR